MLLLWDTLSHHRLVSAMVVGRGVRTWCAGGLDELGASCLEQSDLAHEALLLPWLGVGRRDLEAINRAVQALDLIRLNTKKRTTLVNIHAVRRHAAI